MKAFDIVGYTFAADQFHPDCLTLPTGEGEPFDGWALAAGAGPMSVEENLNEIGAAFGFDRYDESSFDSGDFPKVIFSSQVESDDDVCGKCGGALRLPPNPTCPDHGDACVTQAECLEEHGLVYNYPEMGDEA